MSIEIGAAGTIASVGGARPGVDVSVKFAPGAESGNPLDRLGGSIVDQLKNFEATRAESRASSANMSGETRSSLDTARAQLSGQGELFDPARSSRMSLSGPASAGGVSPGSSVDQAISSMTKSFDYAIETQLIVKTGSQVSTSASSLLRGG